LAEVCPNSISTDKIKAIHERNDTQINIEKNRMIEDASIKQLAELSLLLSAENKITSERGVI
jgi:hypothetical protein